MDDKEDRSKDQDFHSSELGTKEYWDAAYKQELEAFAEIGDIGEVWFGEDVQHRMVRWVSEKSGLPNSSRVLDLGCGNGALLLALREEDFTDLTGVDYSEAAIQLAVDVAQKEDATDIKFQVCDILSAASVSSLCRDNAKFDICLDKGTYDAISLRDASDPSDRILYISSVRSLLSDHGRLIITSCNWTKEQLTKHFQKDFVLVSELPAPTFSFGGATGQTVTTLIFKLQLDDKR